jgi:hypothetical protein
MADDAAGPHYRDATFAVLFCAQLLGVVVLAIAQARHVAAELPTAGLVSARTLRICVGACAASVAFSACWLAVLRQHARARLWARVRLLRFRYRRRKFVVVRGLVSR